MKDNLITVRLTTEEVYRLNLFLETKGISVSNFVREAIDEKLTKDNPEYLSQKEKELVLEIEKIRKQKKFLRNRKKEKISEEEKKFLTESKEIISKNPAYIEGRLKKYINDFNKSKISKQEFSKLIEEAEKDGEK